MADNSQLAPDVINAPSSDSNPIRDALAAVNSLVTPNSNDADKVAAISQIAQQKGLDPAALLAVQQKAEAANPTIGAPQQPFADPNTVLPPSPIIPNSQDPAQANEMALQQAQNSGQYAAQAGGPQDINAMSARSANALQQMTPQLGQEAATPETPKADASQFVPATSVPAAQKAAPTPEAQGIGELQKAYAQQQQGIASAAKVGASKAAEFMGANDKIADEMKTRESDLRQKQQSIETETNGELDKLKNIQYDIANSKIDPDHFYKDSAGNVDTGKKISAGLAIALGGIGGALTGKGGNVGMDLISKAIDRDIDAQKSNIENMKAGAQVQTSILSQMQRKFDSAQQAEAATRSIYIDQAKAKLASLASKYEGPEIQAKAQQLMGQLNEEQAKTLYQFRSAAEQKALQRQIGGNIANTRNLTPEQRALAPEEYRNRFMEGWGLGNNKEQVSKFSEYANPS